MRNLNVGLLVALGLNFACWALIIALIVAVA